MLYGNFQLSTLNSQLLLCLALLLLISCASKPQIQIYFESDKPKAIPDSAKVKAVLSVSQNNVKERLSAVLFTVPNKKYRLELSGIFGLSAASILWKDNSWKIVLPQDERYMEGTGSCIFIPVYGNIDIHKFATLFLGQRANSLDCDDLAASDLILEYKGNSVSFFFGQTVETDNYPSLQLEIKNIDPKAQWKSGVWNLNVPESYVRITDY